MNIDKAYKNIYESEQETGGKRADCLENAIHNLMVAYVEELKNIGTNKNHINELVKRDWLNDTI